MDVQTLVDIEEIKQLRYGFAWGLDTARPDELADLFTEDAVIDVGAFGTMRGREAIRRGYGRQYAHGRQFDGVHMVTNPRIMVEAETAHGSWYLMQFAFGPPERSAPNIAGLYEDEYRKEAGRWRISSMTLTFLWTAQKGRIAPGNPMTLPGR